MQEFFDSIISFIKGLMQPLITIFALYVGASLISSGKVTADQAWLIPVGVIAYWFADKSGIWDALFGKAKSGGSVESTGTPPKATSGISTAVADDVAAKTAQIIIDTWNGQGGYDAQKVAADAAKQPEGPEVSTFNRAAFDASVEKAALSNPSWSDKSPESLALAAEVVYSSGYGDFNKPTRLDITKAMIGYSERWFKSLFFGDANFICVDADNKEVSPIEYVRLHLNDANVGCPTCGKDVQACRPKTVVGLVDYAGINYRLCYNFLAYYYRIKAESEIA